ESRARALHERILTVDTHCDTPMRMVSGHWDIGERHEPGKRASGKVDLPRMAEGGLDAEFFAIFVAQGERAEAGYSRARERALAMLGAIHRMVEQYPGLVGLALAPEDAYRLKKEGKRAAFIGMENGYPVGKNLVNLEEYYRLGVRYLTLCHGSDNDICDSSTERENPDDNGLSDFGKEVVAECNRLGIMVDVSHASDKSFFDVLEVSQAPVIASHSSCRALCDSPRNLTDEMIQALARKGGVIQVCLVSSFLRKPEPNPERDKALQELRARYGSVREIRDEAERENIWKEYEAIEEKYPEAKATVKDVADHIDHVVKVAGIDHVGIGTDFDGGGGVEGCNDVSEMFRLTAEFLRRGYTEEEVEKIWAGNVMRVFRQVIDVSRSVQADTRGQI
ncbi:MAG: membrane dipeptidase, partial [Candidatus Aminicenantes bacterium]|nr:membrane dipeptidase [Candidatus Aminicenantes bacterium]